jgi:Zn-dependent protease
MNKMSNPIQRRVLQRLEANLPPTRWQQFILQLLTLMRQLRRGRFSALWFHGKGFWRVAWRPFTVGRLFGVPVQFHITWLIYPAGFLLWLLCDYRRPWKEYFAVLMLLVICVSLLAHEFAHVLLARRFGISSQRVIIIPPGAVALLESALDSPSEFWIALAGPLASLLLAGVFRVGFYLLASWHESWEHIWFYHFMRACEFGWALNWMMAGFNLVPCFPMDGGRMLRSLLAVTIGRTFPRPERQAFVVATLITVRYVAWPVALGMMVYAIFQLDYWIYLLLFPLLLAAAEVEYWELRTNDSQSLGEHD